MQHGMVSVYYHSSTIAMSHCLNYNFGGSSLPKGSHCFEEDHFGINHIIHYLVYHIHCKVIRNHFMLRNSMVYRILDHCIGRLVVETYHVVAGCHIIHCLETLAIAFATDDGRINSPFDCSGIAIVVGSKNSIDYFVLNAIALSLVILVQDNMILVNLVLLDHRP